MRGSTTFTSINNAVPYPSPLSPIAGRGEEDRRAKENRPGDNSEAASIFVFSF